MDTASPSKLVAIRFGDFEVDPRAGELRKQGVKIKLQEQPFQLLQVLLERPGEVVTREELRKKIWPSDTFVDFDGGVNNAVKRLREALGDRAETPRFIETLPRRGYRFIGTVNGNGARGEHSVESPGNTSPASAWSLRIGLGAGAGVVVLLVVLLGAMPADFWQRLSGKNQVPQIRSLAVLPLRNLSGEPGQEYFAEAMTEELITELSRISALTVISRSSSLAYRNSNKSLPEIARELHADAIVEGSVQRTGNRVRVTAQLIHAAKDTNVWAQSYDRDLRDALTLQSDLATAIAAEIRVQVKPRESTRLKTARPVNHKALEDYLAGRDHINKAAALEFLSGKEQEYEREIHSAVESFQQAVQEDPNYVPAYLGIFDIVDSHVVSHTDLLPSARKGIKKAMELDESLVEPHLDLALLLMQWDYDYEAAGKEYQRALELAPRSADVHAAYAGYLSTFGRDEESDRELELAQELDPNQNRHLNIFPMNWTLEQDRQYLDEGTNRKSVEADADDPFLRAALGKAFQARGRYKEAVEQYIKTADLYGYHDQAKILHRGYAKGNYKGAIRDWMKEWAKLSQRQYVPAFWPAFLYAGLGDKEAAFPWLEKAYRERSWCMLYLNSDKIWDPIRSDPRFVEYVHMAGLPADHGQFEKQREAWAAK